MCVGFLMCACFGNMYTCIYRVFYCLYCFLYCFACAYLFWSEVKWGTVKFLGIKVPRTLGWFYTEGTWLFCGILFGRILYCVCFNLCCGCYNLFCNVWVCKCVGFVMCVCVFFVMCWCSGSMCTCIYCVLYFLYCVFLYCSFTYIYFYLLYVFFWVVPRRLNFICRRFGILPMKMEQSVPKRRGITQKKAYNIQNTAKVWNQQIFLFVLFALVSTTTATEWQMNCS